MSVAPDMLLRSAPEVKPKATPAKAPERSPEPSNGRASEFSQVYARERQNKVAERADNQARDARDSKTAEQNAQTDSTVTADPQPPVADSGKELPDEAPLVELDPLLLLGMTGEPLVAPDESPAELSPVLELTEGALESGASAVSEAPELLPAANSLISSGPAQMSEASFDPELDALNQLPGVRMALAIGEQEKQSAEQASKAAQLAGQGLAASLEAEAKLKPDGTKLDLAELQLAKLSVKAQDVLKEGASDATPENFVSKLNSLSQAIAQQHAQVRSAPVVGLPVPMHQGAWSEAVVDRVMLMSSQNLKTAEIQLDPAELGRLEVRINVNQEQTQVTFASPNANVRDALEAQMHRLREMLGQQGMSLLDASVSDQSLSRGWQGQGDDASGRGGSREEGTLTDEGGVGALSDSALVAAPVARGLVDYYA